MESQGFLVEPESIFFICLFTNFWWSQSQSRYFFKHPESEPETIFSKRLCSLYPVASTEQQHKHVRTSFGGVSVTCSSMDSETTGHATPSVTQSVLR